MSSDELLPCPFCGGEAVEGETEDHIGRIWPTIQCTKCPAEIGYFTSAEAIAAWNTRQPPPQSGEMGEAMKKARSVAAEIVRRGAPGCGNGNKVIANEIKGGLHDDYAIVQTIIAALHPTGES